jgi:hypothetical protein
VSEGRELAKMKLPLESKELVSSRVQLARGKARFVE